MTAVYLGAWTPGTDEWREHRRDKVGGSDVAAILGLSKWQSAYSLWHERRGQTQPGPEKPQMEWGTRLEPVIAQAWRERHPEFIMDYEPGAVFAHPERPWQVASPDAVLYDDEADRPLSGLEVKTSRWDDGWGPDGSDLIPPYYATQVQWCMDVLGVSTWHVACLFSGSDYREYTLTAHAATQEALRDVAGDFLDSLAEGRVPPIDGHDSTYETVRELHPDLLDEDVEVGDLGRRWVDARHALEWATAEEQESRSLMAAEVGNRRRALLNGQRIAYRQRNAGGVPFIKAVNGLLDKIPASAA